MINKARELSKKKKNKYLSVKNTDSGQTTLFVGFGFQVKRTW